MGTSAGEYTLATALDTLIRKRAALEGRGDLTAQDVADAIRRGGGTISHTTVWKLRTGRDPDPRRSTLQTLADYFGVPIVYFFDRERADEINRQLDELRYLSRVKAVAARLDDKAGDLSLEGWAHVTEVIRRISTHELGQRAKDE